MKNTKKRKYITKFSKVFTLVGCILLVTITSVLPCFAAHGDITTDEIKGMWRLKYTGFTDSRVAEDWSFICTETVANNMQPGSKPFQVLTDSTNVGYSTIWIDLNDGETQRQAVAYYSGDIGTRGFSAIVLGYTYPNKDASIVGQKCTLSCIMLVNYGQYTNSGEIQVVDYLMVMIDYANMQWSNNLDYIDFGSDYNYIYIDSGNVECINYALKAFGTNAFGAGVSNNGAFVPIGVDNVPPTSEAFTSFLDAIYSTLGNILSIQFFGWYSIGSLIGVFMAISIVLVFLKYFAGG